MTETTDTEVLVERARRGDRAAFGALLDRFTPNVRAFLHRLGCPSADLDDLAQEVFVIVIRALPGYRAAARFETWLLGVAVNAHRTAWRRRLRAPEPRASVDAEAGTSHADPGAALERRELGLQLRHALLRLPEPLREAFVLRHVEDLPVDRCAAILALPEGTVRRHAFEARARLQDLLASRLDPESGPRVRAAASHGGGKERS